MSMSTRYLRRAGFTLVELMVSMALGLLIVLALTTLLVNVNSNNSELSKTNRQIENSRFAMQILGADLVHAGFWGRLGYTAASASLNPFPTPTAIPSPCTVAGWDDPYKINLLGVPVQLFADGSALGACNVAGVLPSSNVILVRHANTCVAGSAGCDGGTDTGPHIQVSACRNEVPPEAMFVIDSAVFPLKEKDCTTIAARRKIVSNIYYIANSNGIPTLMRVTISNGVYSSPQPLIEGIDAFRAELGVDTLGKNGLPVSATNPGDGSADVYVACAPCSLDQLANTVAVKIHILARNIDPTPGYTDSKSYQLGGFAVAAANDRYKRHVYTTTVRLVNPSGRREVP